MRTPKNLKKYISHNLLKTEIVAGDKKIHKAEVSVVRLLLKRLLSLGYVFYLLLLFVPALSAQETAYEARMVNAIRLAENNPNYGVLSEKCSGESCRQICLNSVRNNLFRYLESTNQLEKFVQFMGDRYAPTKGATNDPKKLNKNWVKNVLHIFKNNRSPMKKGNERMKDNGKRKSKHSR